MIISSLLIILLGGVSAADNTPHDAIMNISSGNPLDDSFNGEDVNESVQEYDAKHDNENPPFAEDIENQSVNSSNNSFSKIKVPAKDFPGPNPNEKSLYDNQYYLFRGDCWVINNNFESTAAVTSQSFTDLTVTGTFRTQSDMVGLYWYSKDPIQHPYISYGSRSDYSNVVLEFDYQMSGCTDFSKSIISIAIETNNGETYYLTMNKFIKKNHVKIDFNKLALLPGNSYFDKNGRLVTVKKQTKLDVTNLKSIMFVLVPVNFVDHPNYKIMKNADFTCRISNINVVNGAIRTEQPALDPHQYRLCEDYDDIFNMNPLRISNEMRKLGYVGWVDLYIGASHYYEKYGTVGDVIAGSGFTNSRTEKMVLNKNVPLNKAFKTWLDCYSRQLKKNNVENLIISVSMENLQSPHSWRQMDCNGNFAVTDWNPSTFIYSPCNDEVVQYMQRVSGACLDIVVANGFKPILQMGEIWWWWNEQKLPNQSPCFYDDSTKAKYLAEHGTAMPEYANVWTADYDNATINWLNQQLVKYSDALRSVVKSDKYDEGLYIALFFLPSIIGNDRVPPMITDVNYLPDAYSPFKLDILQIEDYDWVIFESIHHREAFAIGYDLGFNESNLHYFGGFVLYPEDAAKYWPLIEKALEDAIEHKFKEVYIWSGTQVRRDSKILGYDEYAILENLLRTNTPGIVSPIITVPEYVCAGENFSINIRTNAWVNGAFKVYEYNNGKKGKFLASNKITNGHSAVSLSSDSIGLNRFYLEFDYVKGEYHLIQEIYIVGNSPNVNVSVTGEIESGSVANITFNAPESPNAVINITVDGIVHKSYLVDHGKFRASILRLSNGYHNVLIKYEGGKYVGGKFIGDAYYKTFTVKVAAKSIIETSNVTSEYNSAVNLAVNLKDSKGNALNDKIIKISLNGKNYTVTTDKNGHASLQIDLLPGEYIAELFYAGDGVYLSSFATSKIVVKKIATGLAANDINLIYGDSANLVVSLKDGKNNVMEGKDIIITLNGIKYTLTTDKQGKVSLPIGILPGKYTAKILFEEDDEYLSSSANANVVVDKSATILTVNEVTNNLIITLKDAKNKALKGKDISINLNGKNHTIITDNNGRATLPIDLIPGEYVAKISFKEDNAYLSSSATISVIINKIATSLSSNNLNFTYGNPNNLFITLKDIKNNALKGKDIAVNLNGVTHTVVTDNNGHASLPIDLLPGKYTAKIQFREDNIYVSSFVNVDVLVNKVPTNLISKDVSFTYGDSADLLATLKDTKGNVLKGKVIVINLNGANHTAATANNGQAALPIDLMPGKYAAKIQFIEDSIYMSSSADANIVINKAATALFANDINVTYGDSAKLLVTLKDSKGAVLKGKAIIVNLNGVNHNVSTDSNGQAVLSIDLLAGKYAAKIQFSEDNAYLSSFADANIVINKAATVLFAKDVTVTYGDSAKLFVTLKDSKGAVLKGRDISVNLNGVNHNVATDSNGQASLPIDMIPGKYAAKIQFSEDNAYLFSSAAVDIVINKVATTLTSENINAVYGDSVNMIAALKDSRGNILKGKYIVINLNGVNRTVATDNNGQVALPIDLLPGIYVGKIQFKEDSIYEASATSNNINVSKATTGLTSNDINIVYGDSTNLIITLKSTHGNVLVGKSVTVKLNNKNYIKKTNASGQVLLNVNLPANKYDAKIGFAGDDTYLSSTHTAKVIVNKATSKITASSKTFKAKSKVKKVTVTLKNKNKNKAIKNTIVKLTVNKKTYKVKTNSKGIAIFSIKLIKKGKYDAVFKYGGSSNFKSATKNIRITIK